MSGGDHDKYHTLPKGKTEYARRICSVRDNVMGFLITTITTAPCLSRCWPI